MSDDGMKTEHQGIQPAISGQSSGRWDFLHAIKQAIFKKNTPQIKTEQEKETIQIPPESGYAKLIKTLEKKNDPTDLTANELTKLYPHFVVALRKPKLKVDEGGREELLELLNSGNLHTIVKLAEFVRDDYLNGQTIATIQKKSNNNLDKRELEAILADQLINRLKRGGQEQKSPIQSVPGVVVNATEGITLDPDVGPGMK